MKKDELYTIAPFLLVIITLCCGTLLMCLISVVGNLTGQPAVQPLEAQPHMSNPTQPIQQPFRTASPAASASTPPVRPGPLQSPPPTLNRNSTPATALVLPTVVQPPTIAQPTLLRLPTLTPLPTLAAFSTVAPQQASTAGATPTLTPATPSPPGSPTPTASLQPSAPTPPTVTPSPTTENASVPFFCDCSLGDILDCEDFDSQAEAQACFEHCGGTANDVFNLDADGDGIACEELGQ